MSQRTSTLLLTDLYELTMSAAFFKNNFNPTASFELFVRRLPEDRGYLLAAGLEQALEFAQDARFRPHDIEFLKSHPAFQYISPKFFDYLGQLRFTGDIWAVPEGTVVFPEEPILRVNAPLIESQILETYLLSTITYQTLVATKAARVVHAAQGKDVIEFGTRRAHGPHAGLLAARASFIGGCAGTSNVEAGRLFGIPTFGTMAHSFVMAHPDETEAFQRYTQLFPHNSVLLIDTYDAMKAVDGIIQAKLRPTAVRIDSGDLAGLSLQVRARLDAAGLQSTKILLSGDLDEFRISELNKQGAKADSYGVGTSLVVSNDAPALGGVYKLVELETGQRKSYHAKFSSDKATYPGTKQLYRFLKQDGSFDFDLIACAGESVDGAEPMLRQVMKSGKRTGPSESLKHIQATARQQVSSLSGEYRLLKSPARYPVKFSPELQRLQSLVKQTHAA